MSNSPSARFQIVDAPTRAPGNCFLCRGTNPINGPFIDTRLEHDFYLEAPNPEHEGNVYICRACVEGMANTLELSNNVVDAQIIAARTAGVVEGIEIGRRALNGLHTNLGITAAIYSHSDSSGDDNSVQDVDFPETGNSASDTNSKQGVEQVDKPISGKGRSGVSGNSSS